MSLTLLLCKQSPELKHPSGVAEAETAIGMKSNISTRLSHYLQPTLLFRVDGLVALLTICVDTPLTVNFTFKNY
jgi:hypothetical protein